MASVLVSSGKECVFFKADHESAYKQLPIRPDHARLAVVALKNPFTGEIERFAPNALVFGSLVAVL